MGLLNERESWWDSQQVQIVKPRLVTKGYHQRFIFEFNELFSLVVKLTTIRFKVIIALTNKCDLQQIDINNVFNNDSLQEDLYMS